MGLLTTVTFCGMYNSLHAEMPQVLTNFGTGTPCQALLDRVGRSDHKADRPQGPFTIRYY